MLVRRKANFWIALIPMLFMTTITIWALVNLIKVNLGTNYVLLGATSFLLIMAVILAGKAVGSLVSRNK